MKPIFNVKTQSDNVILCFLQHLLDLFLIPESVMTLSGIGIKQELLVVELNTFSKYLEKVLRKS